MRLISRQVSIVMTQSGHSRLSTTLGRLTVLAALAVASLCAQRSIAQTSLKGGTSQNEYTDQSSENCEQQNANNPYTGMNPLTCHGESAPTDSSGECSLNIGTVWKKDGNTCYYCAPINPPIQGIIIPLDNVGTAQLQGYGCGTDQADACMAVCSGGKPFIPQEGTTGGPSGPPTPPLQGGVNQTPAPHPGPPLVAGAKNPCLPFGPGGYDYCANPPEARPPQCVCPNTTFKASTSSENTPCQPAPADQPAAASSVRFQLGFEAGSTACSLTQTVEGDVAVVTLGSDYSAVPQILHVSASAQTIQSVVHPAGASSNPDPFLEGQAEGGKLCAWLLQNDAGKIAECPGATPPKISQPPLTASASVECAPLSKDGYIFCAGSSGNQTATCDCNDQITISTSTTGQKPIAGSADAGCAGLLQRAQKLPKLTPTQIKILELDLTNAKTMLTRAKQHLDNNVDPFAASTMWIYFDSTSSDVRGQIGVIIDSELALLGKIGLVEQHIYPDLYAGQKNSPIPSWAAAFAMPSQTKADYPMFFLRDGYWKSGSEGRAMLIVHELSHLNAAGGAVDLTYDTENCFTLAHYSGPIQDVSGASQALQGKNFGTGTGQLPTAYMKAVNTKTPDQWQLVPISTPTNAALVNADSIALFVQQLAGYPLATEPLTPFK
jgi:hypothetical protein